MTDGTMVLMTLAIYVLVLILVWYMGFTKGRIVGELAGRIDAKDERAYGEFKEDADKLIKQFENTPGINLPSAIREKGTRLYIAWKDERGAPGKFMGMVDDKALMSLKKEIEFHVAMEENVSVCVVCSDGAVIRVDNAGFIGINDFLTDEEILYVATESRS